MALMLPVLVLTQGLTFQGNHTDEPEVNQTGGRNLNLEESQMAGWGECSGTNQMAEQSVSQGVSQERVISNWKFRFGHDYEAAEGWEEETVPHDWAISGPFGSSHDVQTVAIVQNGETEATRKEGRTGGLPWVGKGCYATDIQISETAGRHYELLFDGAMSHAQVLVNGAKVGEWPYGYNSFHFDITENVKEGSNHIVVLLENQDQSSRWYPGAGLYRKVRLISAPEVHIPVWGTYITTPKVTAQEATITVSTQIEGAAQGDVLTLQTSILDAAGRVVAVAMDTRIYYQDQPVTQQLMVKNPDLWSPENPALYTARTVVMTGGSAVTERDPAKGRNKIVLTAGKTIADQAVTTFGIRSIEFRPMEGFFLNGEKTMFKGVCNHHDLGPLGAAINVAALRHQLVMLKDMGCNAIRTSHNMPAEELVQLCDQMGFMLMVEPFDEWDVAKTRNGYHLLFNDWAEKDMVNMVRHFRNNPSVVMWSIGNEVPSQGRPEGPATAKFLQDICHREDPTRPVTCGMDQIDAVLANGFAAVLDIPSFNYKVDRFEQAYALLPQGFILSSESASTVSSRGVYYIPAQGGINKTHPDNQSCSYDLEYCSWSNIPDEDFAADEDLPYVMGQFVWTGFDYLGEPTPYNRWPNHSSMFGIIDLASLPKDRFYLYRSVWNPQAETLHILPHWNWEGHQGENVPVYVYTSYPQAELFLNGRSLGRRAFSKESVLTRHRLMWEDVPYEKGELKVVAYDASGKEVAQKTVRTAGKAYTLQLSVDRQEISASGEDLAYVTITAVDRQGNPCPLDNRQVNIKVSGAGRFQAVANGDPTCLESFVEPHMHLFSGQMTAIVRSGLTPGEISLEASAKGLKKSTISISVR